MQLSREKHLQEEANKNLFHFQVTCFWWKHAKNPAPDSLGCPPCDSLKRKRLSTVSIQSKHLSRETDFTKSPTKNFFDFPTKIHCFRTQKSKRPTPQIHTPNPFQQLGFCWVGGRRNLTNCFWVNSLLVKNARKNFELELIVTLFWANSIIKGILLLRTSVSTENSWCNAGWTQHTRRLYRKTIFGGCQDISPRRHFTPGHFTPVHFTPKTFHPEDISPHGHFTPRTFHPTFWKTNTMSQAEWEERTAIA